MRQITTAPYVCLYKLLSVKSTSSVAAPICWLRGQQSSLSWPPENAETVTVIHFHPCTTCSVCLHPNPVKNSSFAWTLPKSYLIHLLTRLIWFEINNWPRLKISFTVETIRWNGSTHSARVEVSPTSGGFWLWRPGEFAKDWWLKLHWQLNKACCHPYSGEFNGVWMCRSRFGWVSVVEVCYGGALELLKAVLGVEKLKDNYFMGENWLLVIEQLKRYGDFNRI